MIDLGRGGGHLEESAIRDPCRHLVRREHGREIQPKRRANMQRTAAGRTARMIPTLRLRGAGAGGVVQRVRDQIARHDKERE